LIAFGLLASSLPVIEAAAIPPGAAVIGAVTLTSSSSVDLGSETSTFALTDSSMQTWVGTLSIYNWSGTAATGNGTDQLYFGTGPTGLKAKQLTEIAFYSNSRTTFLGVAGFASGMNGEIVPVAEPGTWFAAALALCGLGFTQRRRVRDFYHRFARSNSRPSPQSALY
jgi:MYXO-CTERM domain-containing protein